MRVKLLRAVAAIGLQSKHFSMPRPVCAPRASGCYSKSTATAHAPRALPRPVGSARSRLSAPRLQLNPRCRVRLEHDSHSLARGSGSKTHHQIWAALNGFRARSDPGRNMHFPLHFPLESDEPASGFSEVQSFSFFFLFQEGPDRRPHCRPRHTLARRRRAVLLEPFIFFFFVEVAILVSRHTPQRGKACTHVGGITL